MIADELVAYISAKVPLMAPLRIDFLEDEEKALCLRQLPSTYAETIYLDGTRAGRYDFSIFGKAKDSAEAQGQLEAIERFLSFNREFKTTAGTTVKMEVITPANFIGKAPKGEYTYSDTIKIEYIGRVRP